MKNRIVLFGSIAVNLVLVGALVMRSRSLGPVLPTETAEAATSPAAIARPVARTSDPSPAVTRTAPFHWSDLESTDYHQYIANLRAIGCPEQTIRDIIIADINK